MFIHYNGKAINTHYIRQIDCINLVGNGYIRIIFTDNRVPEIVEGPEAFNIVMAVCPAVLEGKRAKYVKNSWAVHNLIGHPLMQIFSWLRLPALGIKIHDVTIPEPAEDDSTF